MAEAQANPAAGYKIEAAPDVISVLKGALADTVKAMEKENGFAVKYKVEVNFGDESFQVVESPKKKS